MNKLIGYYMLYDRRSCRNGTSRHFYCVAENEDIAQEMGFIVYNTPCNHIIELRLNHALHDKLFESGKHGYLGTGPEHRFHVYENRQDKINSLLG